MERFWEGIAFFFGYFFMAIAMMFVGPILSTLFGVVGGWFVGLFFGDTILGFLAQIGIIDLAMWQVGAILGFISGFFRTSLSFNKRAKK